MGGQSWSSQSYRTYTNDYSKKTTNQIFDKKVIDTKMDPKEIKFRESRDNANQDISIPICIFLDVTGSMGSIPEKIIKEKLGILMDTFINHGLEGAQVLFGAIGDQHSDSYPIQAGQFESGTDEINKSLASIVLEGKGGGSGEESYQMGWFFASRMTSTDSFDKRGRKGFLFTIGDEYVHDRLSSRELKKWFNYDSESDLTTEQILEEVQESWETFHIHIMETSQGRRQKEQELWKKLLGERVLFLDNYSFVAELIATTVAVINGKNLKDIVSGFSSGGSSVTSALQKFDPSSSKVSVVNTTGVMKL